MGLTALALLWLLWRLSGLAGLMVGIAASAVILRQLFQWGMARHTVRDKTMTIAFVAAVAIAALLILPAMPRATTQAAALPGDEFSETRLAKLRAEGKPLFVYFTADWCVTCKINEAAAINREDTKAAFAKAGVVTLKGDFTRRDPAIARFLSQHGRSGVPLYLYYPVGGEAQILPQILTGDTLQNLAK
jgi:thiol:disulfide interchange protein